MCVCVKRMTHDTGESVDLNSLQTHCATDKGTELIVFSDTNNSPGIVESTRISADHDAKPGNVGVVRGGSEDSHLTLGRGCAVVEESGNDGLMRRREVPADAAQTMHFGIGGYDKQAKYEGTVSLKAGLAQSMLFGNPDEERNGKDDGFVAMKGSVAQTKLCRTLDYDKHSKVDDTVTDEADVAHSALLDHLGEDSHKSNDGTATMQISAAQTISFGTIDRDTNAKDDTTILKARIGHPMLFGTTYHNKSFKDDGITTDESLVERPKSPKEEEYFKPLKKLRMLRNLASSQGVDSQPRVPHGTQCPSRLKSFSISDILAGPGSTSGCSHDPNLSESTETQSANAASTLNRPWDTDEEEEDRSSSESPRPASTGAVSIASSAAGGSLSLNKGGATPLDALFKMTKKTFDGNHELCGTDKSCKQLGLFGNKQPMKRKRKSRTAFSNRQLFELEKRFLYQKYLSPIDRDELSQGLGLSNAQVITWFQNRRAKLKRDMEDIKKDVHASFLKTVTQMGFIRSKSALELPYIGNK